MTAPVLDDFLLRLAPAPPVPVAQELLGARTSIRAALSALREVPDSALERVWHWRGGELDVRYGFYRQYEEIEDTRARINALVAPAHASETPARPLVASATAARWDLHGVLAGLDDADLDRDPGNGEWTLRQTLAHIVSGQRAYGWFTYWWLSQRDRPLDDFPARVPDDVEMGFPEEETEGLGTLAEIQGRLDDILDLGAGVFAPLGAEDLAVRARWSGLAVDVRFRLVRWSSHIREHTIQVEKTLAFIGRLVTEVDRLLWLIAAAYGRLEEDLLMLPADDGKAAEALALAKSAAERVASDAQTVVEAARA
ncbi:MAG: DinB family protein [Candidatus Limnocylindrales bacterium]